MFPDNDAVRGMLEQIAYMVEIEETKGEAQ
jgi:ribosomal protein L30/L7E